MTTLINIVIIEWSLHLHNLTYLASQNRTYKKAPILMQNFSKKKITLSKIPWNQCKRQDLYRYQSFYWSAVSVQIIAESGMAQARNFKTDLAVFSISRNKPGPAQVGAISKAQK